jgi:hypothetical protein
VDVGEGGHLPEAEDSIREADDEEVGGGVKGGGDDLGAGLEEVVALLEAPASVRNGVVGCGGGGSGSLGVGGKAEGSIVVVVRILIVLLGAPGEDGSIARDGIDL